MRLLHGADAHAGLATLGRPVDEVGQSLVRFAEEAARLDVDLAVWSGDTFHSRRPGPTEIRQALAAIGILRRASIPVVIGTGNHDGYGTVADAESHTLAWLRDLELDGVYVMTRREVQTVPTAHGSVKVGHLPYPHKRTFAAATDDPAEQVRLASKWAEDEVTRLAEEGTELLVAHVSVTGARLGSETAMQLGWDTTISDVVLEPFRYAALGHIHVQQEVARNAWYAGSPEYMSFGEEGEPKGWLLVTFDSLPIAPSVSSIWSSTRQLYTVDVYEDGPIDQPMLPPETGGNIIRLRLHPSGRLDGRWARRVVDAARSAGAAFVKVEVVEAPQTRVSRLPASEAVDLDPLVLLGRWLELNGVPTEPAMTYGREAVYSARNEEGTGG